MNIISDLLENLEFNLKEDCKDFADSNGYYVDNSIFGMPFLVISYRYNKIHFAKHIIEFCK